MGDMTANPGGAEGTSEDLDLAVLAWCQREKCIFTDERRASLVRLIRSRESALRARVEALEGALEECATYKAPGERGCSDGNCIIEKPSGLHTNGGCEHLKGPGQYRTGRTLSAVRQIARRALAGGGS